MHNRSYDFNQLTKLNKSELKEEVLKLFNLSKGAEHFEQSEINNYISNADEKLLKIILDCLEDASETANPEDIPAYEKANSQVYAAYETKLYSKWRHVPQTHLKNEFATTDIVWKPRKVSDEDFMVNDNGMLMNALQISLAKLLLDEDKLFRLGKKYKGHRFPYTVIKLPDPHDTHKMRYFAIYRGNKTDDFALGEGTFGKAKLMQDLDTGEWLVAKIQNTKSLEKKQLAQNEIEVMKNISSQGSTQYQTQLIGSFVRSEKNSQGIQRDQMIIGLEYINGLDLLEFICDRPLLPTKRWHDIGLEVLNAAKELHDKGYWHRDIKPENIMISALLAIKLIDFGASITHNTPQDKQMGTLFYMAPEYLKTGLATEKTEVFQLGVTLAVLFDLVDYKLMEQQNESCKLSHLIATNSAFLKKFPDQMMRNDIIQIVKQMMEPDPIKRLDLKTAIDQMFNFSKQHQLMDAPRKIGILDIDVYNSAKKQDQKMIRSSLKNMDEIRLISADPRWVNKTAKKVYKTIPLLSELQRKLGLKVSPHIIHSKSQDKLMNVEQLMNLTIDDIKATNPDLKISYTTIGKQANGLIQVKEHRANEFAKESKKVDSILRTWMTPETTQSENNEKEEKPQKVLDDTHTHTHKI